MLSIGEAEAARTGERIKSVLDAKQEKGEIVYGSAPAGYLRKNKTLVIDPEKQEAVKAVFADYLLNRNIAHAVDTASRHGLTLTRRAMKDLLQNPRYYTAPEPYLTESEWQSIQNSIIHRTRQPKSENRIYLYSGLIVCGNCGHRYIGKSVMAQNGAECLFYACGGRHQNKSVCSNRGLSERKIEAFLLAEIKEQMDKQKIKPVTNKKTVDTKKEIAKLNARLERIGIRFEDGDISIEEYRRKKAEIREKIEILSKPSKSVSLTLPDSWEELYQQLSKTAKKSFWQGITANITIFADRIEVNWK